MKIRYKQESVCIKERTTRENQIKRTEHIYRRKTS